MLIVTHKLGANLFLKQAKPIKQTSCLTMTLIWIISNGLVIDRLLVLPNKTIINYHYATPQTPLHFPDQYLCM